MFGWCTIFPEWRNFMKNQQYKIRRVEEIDIKSICKLNEQLGYPAIEEEVYSRLCLLQNDEDNIILVTEHKNGEIVGWIHGYIYKLIITDPMIGIGGIVVDSQYRKQGIGQALMKEIEKWGKKKECKEIYLRSNVIRKEAHEFYKKLGFHIKKEQYAFYKGF